ncbi:FAD-dependent monooxygenase [bacterium]|nr:FAD-dependent monooxygenase [bacterium]
MSASVPVLVVGGGPVGLMTAATLHHHGIACRIVDKAPQATDKSKALVLWPRTLEHLATLGVADDFMPFGLLARGAEMWAGRTRLVQARFELPGTPFPHPLMIPQSDTERILTEHLARNGVPVERSTELVRLADRGDAVEAVLRQPDGTEEVVRCDWLLGCDGAHSTVRKQAGVEFVGDFEPNDWMLIDCLIDGPLGADKISVFWHRLGVVVFFPFAPSRFRMVADLGRAAGTAHPPTPTLAEAQGLADARGPGGLTLRDPVWLAGFRIHERKVADYRKGRCFLAGDAAHIHSPAGGQGMNTGMQDAFNLAWKLAQVIRGRAAPELLDTYTPEREAVGRLVLKRAGMMTRMATMRNPVAQFFRNRLLGVLGRVTPFPRVLASNLSQLTINYPNSPLNAADPGPGFAGGVPPGDRVPDAPLVEPTTHRPTTLHRVTAGTAWTLIFLPETLAGMADRAGGEKVAAGGVLPAGVPADHVVLDPPGRARALFGARTATAAVVIRPDGVVGYRGQPADEQNLRKYLGHWLVGG